MKTLTSFPSLMTASKRVPRMMVLYRDLLDIPEDMEVQGQPDDIFGTIIQRLAFDMHAAVTTLGDLTQYHANSIEAHLLSRILLEDLYQNEEVHEDYYPTLHDLEDTDALDAVFQEFNLPGKFEGQEF